MKTDGGDAVVTVTGAYDESGATTLTFANVGEYVHLESVISTGTTYAWRVVAYDGVTGPSVSQGAISASSATVAGNLTLSSGGNLVFTGTTGQPEVNLTDNLADSLSVNISGGSDYLVFTTTNSAEKLSVGVDLHVIGGSNLVLTGATGESEINLTDNLADALSVNIPSGGDFLVFDTTNANEKLTILGAATQKLGFYGTAPVVQATAYTQTYATANKTHADPTQQTVTAVANVTGATENYEFQDSSATVTQAEYRVFAKTVKLLVEQIRADMADAKQLINSVIDDLQLYGLLS
jgi:hypothetical protein